MISDLEKEALEAVEDLNDRIMEALGKILGEKEAEKHYHYTYVTYSGTGFACGIEFQGISIWNSENDERVYSDEKDEYEPVFDFVVRQINVMFNLLARIGLSVELQLLKDVEDNSGVNFNENGDIE